jgi:RHH-type proline utilization regulon transcriptional repressor/proline dehydrogenase/delta 1-pyrroline-5-carboxylate dehydrogenase
MSTAALVSGNPIIMKPAEQSSATAFALYERMIRAGFSPDVVHFLPGVGEQIGPLLVQHPHIAQVAFTGSKQVGQTIYKDAAIVRSGQRQMKRVICEMGGKSAIIVDEDADFDEAVTGIVQSAFGFAGQKCSACSRVIVVGLAYDHFVPRLIEAVRSLIIGPAHIPEFTLGPVIDQVAYQRLLSEISTASVNADAKLLFKGELRDGGNFVPPAIFEVTNSTGRLMQEEFFGPILALLRVETFEDALAAATSTEFALTGGVYSRMPSHLEKARLKFRVGNLYINRACTGAMVERQPFGGFGMSGTGIKAGGEGYLRLFVDCRITTENTMRRGFTPELEIKQAST